MSQICRNCSCEMDSNLSVAPEESLRKVGIFVCRRCYFQGKDDEYSMITLTNALKDYALTSQDLSGDGFAVVKKPTSYGRNSFMKLYYRFQVEEAAIKRHGSVEEAFAESLRAEDRKLQKRINKTFGISPDLNEMEREKREMKRKRLEKRLEKESKMRALKEERTHNHEFGDAFKIERSPGNFFKKVCKICDYSMIWEEI
ncbi:DNA repair protein RAD14 [Cryptosporidium felis]|nr:DNA repair protein RAD14 [Cryptosporidium felis]